jgi:hypothetical protein
MRLRNLIAPTMSAAVLAITANCATPSTHEKAVKENTTTTENKVKTAADDAIQATKMVLFELVDKESIKVNFKSGSAEVSVGEQNDLKALVAARQKKGPIARVIIAAWSDKDYPARKEEQLTAQDRSLALERGANLVSVLKGFGISNLETYSMAEYPAWISTTLTIKTSKAKGSNTNKDQDDARTQEIAKKLKNRGGKGKAVVLIQNSTK